MKCHYYTVDLLDFNLPTPLLRPVQSEDVCRSQDLSVYPNFLQNGGIFTMWMDLTIWMDLTMWRVLEMWRDFYNVEGFGNVEGFSKMEGFSQRGRF